MRVPLSWLREFVPVEAEPDALAERLTLGGFAVEEIIRMGSGISGVVVGEVRSVREHPNADNLVLVKAFDGANEHDIVCGARNFGAGDRVPVALPDARLPGGVEIARRVVRGETSDGMLCSAHELEISDDHSGILVLDENAPLGADVVRALELDDMVFHLDVTTNRGDALSVLGVAREVAALYGLPLTVPEPNPPQTEEEASSLARVEIKDPKGCPRYLARVITGVEIGTSPWWMRRRIFAAGMRPISNVVDITNYVLLERGHPLHAFDLEKLTDRAIVVRHPKRGETILTLDDVERKLERDDVVICDADRPVAVAGVMGGGESEVSDKTNAILLESAYFDPLRIRNTAGRLKLRTEASIRFERGADPEAVPSAAARAAQLFAELAGGTVARGAIDVYPRPHKPKAIRLRVARANGLLGTSILGDEMAKALRALGCDVSSSSKTALRVIPPSWRPDVGIEEDLVEEVARIVGLDTIPATLPAGARVGGLDERQRAVRRARRLLLGAGLNEAQTQSLLPPALADRLGLPPEHEWRKAARVGNPVSEEESVLRSSLLPGLLIAAARNVARRVVPVVLFEIGTVFHAGERIHEQVDVAWVLTGTSSEGWHSGARDLDYFDGKGALETLLSGLGVRDWSVENAGVPPDAALLHPGRSAFVTIGGKPMGIIAELNPRAAEVLALPPRVAVATLQLTGIIQAIGAPVVVVPARVPAVLRDIALFVPEETPASEVEHAIREAGGAHLERVALFDVYRGDPVPAGAVSLAFELTVRDPERTLTDAEADEVLDRIGETARARGWTVRD